jgi:LPXTG-motif cell wall-anchored protein
MAGWLLPTGQSALCCVVAKFRPVGDDVKYSLFRRAAVGAFAAAAAVGVSTFFAAPASAHSAGPAGKADCGANGQYTVTWTVKNDFNKPVTISNIKIVGSGETHADIHLDGNGTSSFTTTYPGGKKAELVLSVDALWQDGPHKTWPEDGKPKNFQSQPPVKLTGDCKPTESSPTPSPTPSKTTSKPPTPEASHPATPSPSASTPGLPVTGSNTTLPMVGTGAALIAGGAALVFTIRRRRRVTFTAE